MTEPRFPIVVVEAPTSRADELSAWLFELAAQGVEVRDNSTMTKGPGGHLACLVASFATGDDADAAHRAVREAEPDLACRRDEIVGDAWRDKYKEHFKPFRLTNRLVVAPPWEEHALVEGDRVLVMDPGRAFGTGLHATTSMVTQLLEAHARRVHGARTLDVGTGSGILGLAALIFGAEVVVAIDNDADVIDVAAENAARNGFAAAMHVSATDLAHIDGGFGVVVANIRSNVLIGMAADLAQRADPGALTLLSGILASEESGVREAYAIDFDEVEVRRHHEGADAWVAIALTRK